MEKNVEEINLRFKNWVTDFLEKRSLQEPHGEMLYTYRCTTEEYQKLFGLFRTKFHALQGNSWYFSGKYEHACFVFYASEWWRREYDGGPWRWSSILTPIVGNYSFNPNVCALIVRNGLRYWKLEVNNTGLIYLGSIVVQGGLPVKMIANNEGVISRLLRSGLKNAQTYNWQNNEIESFFDLHSSYLIDSLRQAQIYKLLSDVVLSVINITKTYNLNGVNNPIQILDEQNANWREIFPLSVDDTSVDSLLTSLINDASSFIVQKIHHPISAVRYLKNYLDLNTFQLVNTIEVANNINIKDVAVLCELSQDLIPFNFAIELRGQERINISQCRRLYGGDNPRIIASSNSKSLYGNNALVEQTIVLRNDGNDFTSPASFPGSEELDIDMPWVFSTGKNQLLGVGSVRVRDSSCYIAINSKDTYELIGENSVLTEKGCITDLTQERKVYELTGSLNLISEGQTYIIRTRHVGELFDNYVWKGARLNYNCTPQAVFKGVPRLYKISETGLLTTVPSNQIQWQLPFTNQVVNNLNMHRGPIHAWLIIDGVRIRRFKMVLISRNAAINFQTGTTALEGKISLVGWGKIAVSVDGLIQAEQVRQADLLQINLVATSDTPPTNIQLSMMWVNGIFSQKLNLPFPSAGGWFTDQNGLPIENNKVLALRDLYKVHVQTFGLRFEIGYRLSNPSSDWVTHLIPSGGNAIGEFRLIDLESDFLELLAESKELDSRIKVRITAVNQETKYIYIDRYDVLLKRDVLRGVIYADENNQINHDVLKSLNLNYLPFFSINANEVSILPMSEVDSKKISWQVNLTDLASQPCLVYSTKDSNLQIRPMLIVDNVEVAEVFTTTEVEDKEEILEKDVELDTEQDAETVEIPETLLDLANAMAISDRVVRLNEIGKILVQMSEQFDHPSWQLIVHHNNLLSHLPLCTFDYWKVISSNLEWSLTALFHLESDKSIMMKRMHDELGVMWEMLPFDLMKSAFEQYKQFFHRIYSDALREINTPTEINDLVNDISISQLKDVAKNNLILRDFATIILFQSNGIVPPAGLNEALLIAQRNVGTTIHCLFRGESSLVQTLLVQNNNTNGNYPNFDIPDNWLTLVCQTLNSPITIFAELAQLPPHCLAVTLMPFIAGVLIQNPKHAKHFKTKKIFKKLKEIKKFNPIWFDAAFRHGAILSLNINQLGQ